MHVRIQGIHAFAVGLLVIGELTNVSSIRQEIMLVSAYLNRCKIESTVLVTTVEVNAAMSVSAMCSNCSIANKIMRFSFAAIDPRQSGED